GCVTFRDARCGPEPGGGLTEPVDVGTGVGRRRAEVLDGCIVDVDGDLDRVRFGEVLDGVLGAGGVGIHLDGGAVGVGDSGFDVVGDRCGVGLDVDGGVGLVERGVD